MPFESTRLCRRARLEFTVNGFTRSFRARTLFDAHTHCFEERRCVRRRCTHSSYLLHAEVEFSDC